MRCAACTAGWAVLFAALLPMIASAATEDELSALFLQSCLPYAGRPAALRQWAARAHLPEVADPARAAFLNGTPGKVFDASNATAKLVVLSSDDGICAVVTDKAGDVATAQALQRVLDRNGTKYRLVIERNDNQNPKLHHREYLAFGHGRAWRILAATIHDSVPGQAMLTAAPE